MIFDIISTLTLIISSLTLCVLLHTAGGFPTEEIRREKKSEGWENILNYDHRRGEGKSE